MADITKRANKRLREHLATGETVEVALLVEPAGTYGLAGVAMAALPRTTGRHLNDKAAERYDAAGGIAAELPAEPFALVVTGHRVLMAPTNGLRWKPPALAIPRGQIKVAVAGSKAFGRRVRLAFADGTGADVDVQRGQPLMRLVDAVGTTPIDVTDGPTQSFP